MGKKRVRHSAEFKGKVALEALKWYCQVERGLADWCDEKCQHPATNEVLST